jgi:peptidyl-tRNA hydrolase, PTH1 family
MAGRCGVRIKKPHFLARYESGTGSWQGRAFLLVKPLTFMNLSGEVVKGALRQARATVSDLIIVCDSLDLEPGVLKMKLQGSSGGHHGLDSIFSILKTTDIARLSIGIGRPQGRGAVVDHVLGDPSGEEALALERAIETAAGQILRLLKEPRDRVMGDINRREKRDAHEKG